MLKESLSVLERRRTEFSVNEGLAIYGRRHQSVIGVELWQRTGVSRM